MAYIFLALGSNVGNTEKNIETAFGFLLENISDIKRAPLYVSRAMYHTDQADFRNTVIGGTTQLSPEELFIFIKDIEQKMGRIHRFQNGPREIDIDILLYDDLALETPELSIPHKRMSERRFVLEPLSDIAPDLAHPVLNKSIRTLLEELLSNDSSVI